MRGTPRKARRFGGSASHEKAMLGNMVASLIAGSVIASLYATRKKK